MAPAAAASAGASDALAGNLSTSAEHFLSLVDAGSLTADAAGAAIDDCFWAVALTAGVYAGFAFYQNAPDAFYGARRERIPATSDQMKHALTSFDLWCVCINKAVTVFFSYHMLQWAWWRGVWTPLGLKEAAVMPLHLAALFVVYEFFYYWFHRFLHVPAVYPALHKHHHQQHAPFRGNVDAINTHPVEYVVGEYDHLFALHLLSCVADVHAATVLVFIVVGGYFASLNHTRYNIKLHRWVFAVAAHDTHHRIDVRSNYGQYVMFWDVLFGTFRDSPDTFGTTLSSKKA